MPIFPIAIEDFGGLNLLDAPDEVGFSGAIDMCDVDLDMPGVVRCRDMFAQLATTTLTSPSVVGWGSTTNYIASTAASVKLYNNAVLVGTAAAPNQYFNGSVQPMGVPPNNYLYMADNTGTNAIRRLTTAGVISAPAGMPRALYLSQTPNSNRLVAANIAGTSEHQVSFSDPGAPETFGANNWVRLDPGDGDQITGAVAWRDFTFVFKQSKFYVFYGESTDASGNPIFNYRAIRNQVGALGPPVAGRNGVYFHGYGPRGISVFRTTGTEAVEVGQPIRASLSGIAPSTFTPGNLPYVVDQCFAYGQVRFLVTDITLTKAYVFSYNEENGQWTVWQLPGSTSSLTGYGLSNTLFIVPSVGANAAIHNLIPGRTSGDSLRTPTSFYQSGFDNIAPPRRFAMHYFFGQTRKIISAWRLQGSGSVNFNVAHDFGSFPSADQRTLTLGTAPAVADERYTVAKRGQKISYRLSSSGAWSIQQLTAFLKSAEQPYLDATADR